MQDYTLSIVIPCYNEKNSIRTIVDRVLESPIKNKEIIVVDFFAGSGTTLDAIMQINASDGGKRRCILVQVKEFDFERAAELRDIILEMKAELNS